MKQYMSTLIEVKNQLSCENIYNYYSSALYGVTLKISKNPKEAEDILVQIFKTYFLENTTIKDNGSIFTQLLRLAICIAAEKNNLPKQQICKIIFKEMNLAKECVL